MKLWKRKPPLILSLVTALLLLLPVLAWLQYRWLGQVSQAERERMLANLQRATAQFRQDFDRELTRAYFHFQLADTGAERREIGPRAVRLLGDWQARAPHPRLISDLYWVECRAEGEPVFHRFDAGLGAFLSGPWPEDLNAWRSRLKTSSHELPPQLRMFIEDATARAAAGRKRMPIHEGVGGVIVTESEGRSSPGSAAGWVPRPPSPPAPDGKQVISLLEQSSTIIRPRVERIIEEMPGISIPVFNASAPASAGASPPSAPFTLAGYLVARIDVSYLKREFLPALADRYFGAGNGLDYNLLVVSRGNPREVIFQTDAGAQAGLVDRSADASRKAEPQSDGSTGILAVRLEEFGTLLTESLPGTPKRAETVRADRMTLKVFSRSPVLQPSNVVIPEIEGYWQVFLKHKAGSLEAAVGSVRRRSLAISFGILILLGASIGLLLVSTRRAQRLAEQQMEFVAGVSHELRTPLAVIRSAAENLADGYIGEPAQVKRYGAVIRDEGRRLSEMVEQVLEVAGVQSGRRNYQLHPTDPRQIVEHAMNACRLSLVESETEIETVFSDRLPMINADASALSRAVQNLISNAQKYGGETRWIGLRVEAAGREKEAGNELRIAVADRGIGIPASELPDIFEPFYRGREVVAAQIHGSGLGLSLVKHIVEAHGGRIEVESEPGRGTTFTIAIPALEIREPATRLSGEYGEASTAH